MAFHVYLLRCGDGSYYCGHTDDLVSRMRQHEDGRVGYTATRKPVEPVWHGEFGTREEALAFELQVKGWSRAKKEALISGDWGRIQRLAWGTRNPLPEHLREGGAGASIPQPERSDVQVERGGKNPGRGDKQPGASAIEAERSGEQSRLRGMAAEDQGMPARDQEIPASDQGVSAEDRVVSGEGCAPPSVRPEVSKDGVQHFLPLILQNDRRTLAKAITLLESTRVDHRTRADALLNALLPHTGRALRLGISGVPGVGKSTFIEALGLALIDRGHRVAVLTIDPSSSVSGGSILGDKTRMEKLSVHPQAYVRPSPAAGTLGGVAEKTREAMLVFEAAGYDVVIVETVGVGQSETAVAGMTDMFVLMQLPNAGDDLQAIKRGVMELADLVVINKADLDPDAATRAAAQIESAMRLFSHHGGTHDPHGTLAPRVLQLSALKFQGITAFCDTVQHFVTRRRESGEFDARRSQQGMAWMWDIVHATLQADFKRQPEIRQALPDAVRSVQERRVAPSAAARELLQLYTRS